MESTNRCGFAIVMYAPPRAWSEQRGLVFGGRKDDQYGAWYAPNTQLKAWNWVGGV
jgi:hypothetical protein